MLIARDEIPEKKLPHIYHQEFWWFRKLHYHFPVFFFQAAFKTAQVAWFGNSFLVKGNGLNQVVTKVHHEFHKILDIGFFTMDTM